MEGEIQYSRETRLDPNEFIDVLNDSTLGERRPVDNRKRIIMMCNNANLIITARHKGKLVGIARCLTDFAYCTYLSDLAVSEEYQKKGIGKELVRRVREAVPEASLILLAAPKAVDYYPKIGMIRHEAAFVLRGD
jgi:GNAT superfamily N-acetyltransferase